MSVITLTKNAVGREVPFRGYTGIYGEVPTGNKVGAPLRSVSQFPPNGDKRAANLIEAIRASGLRSGGTVSTHHHLRNGDEIAIQIFTACEALGIHDLKWFPSAVFPCHENLIPFLERGVIRSIEGSLNGPLGDYASRGLMREWSVLRSHGNRYRSIQAGEIHIDLAVIAAPASDSFGNMTGALGPSACGVLGFAVADATYADHVIAVTDHLVDFPCAPWQIPGNDVDQVVCVDRIGDSSKIVSGTTVMTSSPERIRIGENVAKFALAAGILREGWSFQAGAGGVSLAFTRVASQIMRDKGITARFVRGGSNRYLVEMLESGLAKVLLDGQTFDLEGVRSVRENRNHVMTSPYTSYNLHGKGHFASMIDLVVLGATEVDLDFNANVVSHSDGRLLHGIGGWQDALFSPCTVLAVPTMRGRVPILRRKLTTFCGPSELIDVVVTERGTAINPRRQDLIQKVTDAGMKLTTLEELLHGAEKLAGGAPKEADQSGDIVALITWVDGTILDTVRRTEVPK